MKYADWTKEELIKRIEALEKRKKYGLVWEEEKTKEKFEADAEGNLPVLVEDKKREIKTDSDKPTHILIEGDNCHALSVLNYTHAKSIDIIYIDPPYNTGNKDFRYNDSYVDREDGYKHSKWLSFMNKRLSLAKNLLKNTGIIFISIDDNEMAQLKLIMDEIFGENNLIQPLVWQSKYTVANDAKYFSRQHEYVLAYAKNINYSTINLLPRTAEVDKRYSNPDNDPRGDWKSTPLHAKSGTEKSRYEFVFKNGLKWTAPKGTYPRYSKDTLKELADDNRIWFGKSGQSAPSKKTFLSEVTQGVKCGSLLHYSFFGHTHKANEELASIVGKGKFDNPKPSDLISNLIKLSETSKEIVVLDFFAGSGTTAHAVMSLNSNDKGNRQFILCTDNENNICTNVCYPRVQKVMEGYKNQQGEKIKGIGGNLKYYKTNFVGSEPTHRNKKLLTDKSIEMLCIKENTFDEVISKKDFFIFKSKEKFTAILFDEMKMEEFKNEIKKLKMPVSVYVFSLEGDDFKEEFENLKIDITLCSIPEVILKVYRRIYGVGQMKLKNKK